MIQMRKGERIASFLIKLQEIRDQLAAMGSTPSSETMVRLTLNIVTEEWQVFIEIILCRDTLPSWEKMWSALQEEELRRDLVKCKLDGSSGRGFKSLEEEENATVASKEQQGQQRQERDVSKVK